MRKSNKYDYEEVFSRYTENKELKEIHILHLYDTKKQCAVKGDGYVDSRHFKCIAYNYETLEKRDLGIHDGVDLVGAEVLFVRIFADGSTMIKLASPHTFWNTQSITLFKKKEK